MKVGAISLLTALLLAWPLAAMAGNDGCLLDPTDTDSDGICDIDDNCVTVANNGPLPGTPLNCDTDQDGYGNACDGDFDQSGQVQSTDATLYWLADFTTGGVDNGRGTDMNCNGQVQSNDVTTYWLADFTAGGSQPGPSGLGCAGTIPCP